MNSIEDGISMLERGVQEKAFSGRHFKLHSPEKVTLSTADSRQRLPPTDSI